MILSLLPFFIRPQTAILVSVLLMVASCTLRPVAEPDAMLITRNQVVKLPLIPDTELPLVKPDLKDVFVAESVMAVPNKSSQKSIDNIAFWLGEAGWAFEQDRLTTPKGESAYYYLTQVLAEDPINPQALAALEKIVQRYYVLLQVSLKQGKIEKAKIFLSRAEKVMPDHGRLVAMIELIENHAVKP